MSSNVRHTKDSLRPNKRELPFPSQENEIQALPLTLGKVMSFWFTPKFRTLHIIIFFLESWSSWACQSLGQEITHLEGWCTLYHAKKMRGIIDVQWGSVLTLLKTPPAPITQSLQTFPHVGLTSMCIPIKKCVTFPSFCIIFFWILSKTQSMFSLTLLGYLPLPLKNPIPFPPCSCLLTSIADHDDFLLPCSNDTHGLCSSTGGRLCWRLPNSDISIVYFHFNLLFGNVFLSSVRMFIMKKQMTTNLTNDVRKGELYPLLEEVKLGASTMGARVRFHSKLKTQWQYSSHILLCIYTQHCTSPHPFGCFIHNSQEMVLV